MTLSEELIWRGFVNQYTFEDLRVLDKKKFTFYHGFDASADSQQIGNLAAMMFDKVFMRHGYKAVILAGGATSLIGDPGGKDKERVLQDEQTIANNVAVAQAQLNRIFKGYEFTLVNNIDWYKDMNVMEFLRDVGKHFSMTPLLQRDYIAQRIGDGGSGISFTEFSYTLLQGYDFLHLNEKHGVELQLAGSDQWGNSLSGVDLIRRKSGHEVHVMTCPLVINQATGKKFGKSEGGAVWLDPKKTSEFRLYQFWLNTDDEGAESYLKFYTELDKDSTEHLISEFNKNRSNRLIQKTLAYEVTKLVHGTEAADKVKHVSDVIFGTKNFAELSAKEIKVLRAEIPSVTLSSFDLVEALCKSGLASSKSEARRFIESGGVYANDSRVNELKPENFYNGHMLLRRGKNNIALVDLT